MTTIELDFAKISINGTTLIAKAKKDATHFEIVFEQDTDISISPGIWTKLDEYAALVKNNEPIPKDVGIKHSGDNLFLITKDIESLYYFMVENAKDTFYGIVQKNKV